MHTPLQSNFPHVDAIACSTKVENSKPKSTVLLERDLIYKAVLFPILITLDPAKHSNSEYGFFKDWKDWSKEFRSTWEVKVVFVWIGGAERKTEDVEADSILDPEKQVAIKDPGFVRETLRFKDVSREIGDKLESVGYGQPVFAAEPGMQ